VDAVLDLSPEFEKVIVAHPDSAPERRVAS
jgi:hypothetical protein